MTETNKTHRSLSGKWVKCDATERACPRDHAPADQLTLMNNIDHIETQILQLDMSKGEGWKFQTFNEHGLTDATVGFIASHPKDMLLSEMIRTSLLADPDNDDWDTKQYTAMNCRQLLDEVSEWSIGTLGSAQLMAPIYKMHACPKSIAKRADNLYPAPAKDAGWEAHFNYQMAHFIINHGEVKALPISKYGHGDYEFSQKLRGLDGKVPQIVAAFNVESLSWRTFEGTFTEDEDREGASVEVVYDTGEWRELVWEGDFRQLMQGIT